METLRPYAPYFGTAAMTCSLLLVFIGLPNQIYKNWKEKKCGIALLLVLGSGGIHLFRGLYAFSTSAIYILIPDCLSLCCFAVIFGQWFYYRRNQSTLPPPE